MKELKNKEEYHRSIIHSVLARSLVPGSKNDASMGECSVTKGENVEDRNVGMKSAESVSTCETTNKDRADHEGSVNNISHVQSLQQQWEEMFERLKSYKEKHGDCLVPNRYAQDRQLGSWVSTQRRNFNARKPSMTQDRVDRLTNIGFVWKTTDPRFPTWSQRYAELCEFYEECGHCVVPILYSPNKPLANWVSSQRREYKSYLENKPSRLTPERIELLNEINFVWDALRHRAPVAAPSSVSSSDDSHQVNSSSSSSDSAEVEKMNYSSETISCSSREKTSRDSNEKKRRMKSHLKRKRMEDEQTAQQSNKRAAVVSPGAQSFFSPQSQANEPGNQTATTVSYASSTASMTSSVDSNSAVPSFVNVPSGTMPQSAAFIVGGLPSNQLMAAQNGQFLTIPTIVMGGNMPLRTVYQPFPFGSQQTFSQRPNGVPQQMGTPIFFFPSVNTVAR